MLVSVGLCEITAAVEQELLPPQLCDAKALEETILRSGTVRPG